MPNSADTLLLAAATVRLTKLVNDDYITEPIRNAVWKRFPPNTKVGYLFTCPWCMSIWTGSALTALHHLAPKTSKAVNTVLAASLATGLIEEHLNK